MPAARIALLLVLFPQDALAWGLQTHVFYAQGLLFALPLLDPELRRAALAFPRLVLAGACLPDLGLAARALGMPAFRRTHGWHTLRRMANSSACDEDRAIALGYASHLLADVVAHNCFVPEHEHRIAELPHLTHALAEWAMDAFVAPQLLAHPGELLSAERECLAEYSARAARCRVRHARRAIDCLAGADRVLRASGLPQACRRIGRAFDRALATRFEAYVRETSLRLRHVGELLAGAEPAWNAEGGSARRAVFWGGGRLLLPARLF
jgi:hypothetical protein